MSHTIGYIHVFPIDDLRPHVLTPHCWCKPVLDEDNDGTEPVFLWVHNALDEREKFETGERKPS